MVAEGPRVETALQDLTFRWHQASSLLTGKEIVWQEQALWDSCDGTQSPNITLLPTADSLLGGKQARQVHHLGRTSQTTNRMENNTAKYMGTTIHTTPNSAGSEMHSSFNADACDQYRKKGFFVFHLRGM